MKKRLITLMTALVLALALGSMTALAAGGDSPAPSDSGTLPAQTPAGTPAPSAPQDPGSSPDPSASPEPSGTPDPSDPGASPSPSESAQPGEDGEPEATPPEESGPPEPPVLDPDLSKLIEETTVTPEPLESIDFSEVEARMREGNLTVLSMEEYITIIDEYDYGYWEDFYRDKLNETASTQWGLVTLPDGLMDEYEKQSTLAQLQQAYDALREQFDAIRNGDMQKDNADQVRQLENTQNQVIVAGEATYCALQTLELQADQLQRQLTALDRTVQEMELRYQLGQISALQLSQTKAGRTSLESGLATLQMNIRSLKYQFEALLGAQQTGEIQLGEIPEVTDEELEAMDLEADLDRAKQMSWELYDAALTLSDAEETYRDDADNYGYNEKKYEYRAALHTWNTAQYSYNTTVQDFEQRFRTLYDNVKDYKQVLDSARVSLENEKSSYRAQQLRYEQGTVSLNALLESEDSLHDAEQAVTSAANDLFSGYNNYRWAVDYGILN